MTNRELLAKALTNLSERFPHQGIPKGEVVGLFETDFGSLAVKWGDFETIYSFQKGKRYTFYFKPEHRIYIDYEIYLLRQDLKVTFNSVILALLKGA